MKVELVLSIVLAACTIIYTIINALMLCESKKSRYQRITPILISYLKLSENKKLIQLYVENVGEGLAKDVTFNFIKNHNLFGKSPVSEMYGFLKNGMNSFPSGNIMHCILDDLQRIDFNLNPYVEIEINYKDLRNKAYKENYKLPFNQIKGIDSEIPDSYLGQIPYQLEQINKKLDKFKKVHGV